MLTGPQSMPVFGDNTCPEEKQAIIAFLKTTEPSRRPAAPASAVGPVHRGRRSAGWSASAP